MTCRTLHAKVPCILLPSRAFLWRLQDAGLNIDSSLHPGISPLLTLLLLPLLPMLLW
jgi:hypothetical protein